MIVAADFLGSRARRSLQQAERVLDHYGLPQDGYSVSAVPGPVEAPAIAVCYTSQSFSNRGPASTVKLATQSGRASFQTHLYAALQLLYLVAVRPRWAAMIHDLDVGAPVETIWSRFGLEQERVLTAKVAAFQTGDFIGPDDGGYAFYSVDTHGELTIEAQAQDLAVVILQYAAMKAYADERIGNLVGQFAAPPA